MKSHCAPLTNNCFEMVSFCLVCFQCCSSPSSFDNCSLQIFESAYVLYLLGKLPITALTLGYGFLQQLPMTQLWLLHRIGQYCVFVFSWNLRIT
ncbi:hypothetical protein Pelo_18774 [Pelomyxa schiedti]|nr:hypothetical protein Pelo_18774 [Pelomyxa schiedti]